MFFFLIYFTHHKLPIWKLIFHSHNTRIFRMCRLVKAWYTFSHKNKLTYLTASKCEKINHIPCRSSHYRMFAVFFIWYLWYLKHHDSQASKQNMILKTYKGLLGTCIKSKKTADIHTYSMYQISSSGLFCQIWLFSMSRKPFLTCTAPRSFDTNVQEL